MALTVYYWNSSATCLLGTWKHQKKQSVFAPTAKPATGNTTRSGHFATGTKQFCKKSSTEIFAYANPSCSLSAWRTSLQEENKLSCYEPAINKTLMSCQWTADIQPRCNQSSTLSPGHVLSHLLALGMQGRAKLLSHSPLTFSCDMRRASHHLTRQFCPSPATQWPSMRLQCCFWRLCCQHHGTPLRPRGHPVQAGPQLDSTCNPLKPALPHELMIKNKPNSLLCSDLHVLYIQKWSCSVLMSIR